MPEIDENHPYIQFLKKQIEDLDAELEKTKQDVSHATFLKEYITVLPSAKDVITHRITDLLSQT